MFTSSGLIDTFSKPKRPLTESHALVFHKLVNGDTVISQHDIDNQRLQTGRFVDKSAVEDTLRQVIGKEQATTGWKDERILFEDTRKIVWYRKASNKPTTLWFRTPNNVIDVPSRLPTIIFVRCKSSNITYLYAAAGFARPTPSTRLYHAPLCNTNSRGSFCWGGATPPMFTKEESFFAQTETCLFESAFSHISQLHTFGKKHGSQVSTSTHIRVWCELAEKKKRPLASDLMPFGKTLSDVLKENFK